MISIIVPVYNMEKYLRKCLDSLVNQTYNDIEIICVNDGSTDKSQDILEQYKNKYPKIIKVINKENGGLSDARNTGIKKAKGDYIGFVDSDDWVELDMFEKMYNYALKNKLDIVVCDTIMEFNNNNYILKSNLKYSDDNIRNYIISFPMACTRLIKRDLFKKEFFFTKGILYEDLCLTPTFIVNTNNIGFLEEPLYHYLQRDNSIMNQLNFNDKLYDISKVLDNVYHKYKDNNVLKQYWQEIEYLYITHIVRSATLRFLGYKEGEKKIITLLNEVDEKFPGWQKNIYLKKSTKKVQIVCYLAKKRWFNILKILLKVRKG